MAPRFPGAFELALWFHDAVYDTKSSDNEERSAEWARSALTHLPEAELDRIERLILVTKHDAAPRTPDEELLLDIDLSILGADSDRFAEYDRQVRREFEWVPDDAYRVARRRILEGFADRPTIFHTEFFRSRLEDRARQNLARAIGGLDDARTGP